MWIVMNLKELLGLEMKYMEALIEIFFVKISGENVLYKKHAKKFLGNNDPNLEVINIWLDEYCGSMMELHEKCVVHSTSWRYDEDGSLILTYLFYSEFLRFGGSDFKIIQFEDLHFPHEFGHEIMGSEYTKEENVLAHGLRHLGLLIKFNGEFYKSKFSRKNFRRLKQRRIIGVAGRINFNDS